MSDGESLSSGSSEAFSSTKHVAGAAYAQAKAMFAPTMHGRVLKPYPSNISIRSSEPDASMQSIELEGTVLPEPLAQPAENATPLPKAWVLFSI